jgi:hypothetical protein
MGNKILGLDISEKDLNLSEKIVDERFGFVESVQKECSKNKEPFNYQDQTNLYLTIKIAQLINRIEDLEKKVAKSDIHFTRFK